MWDQAQMIESGFFRKARANWQHGALSLPPYAANAIRIRARWWRTAGFDWLAVSQAADSSQSGFRRAEAVNWVAHVAAPAVEQRPVFVSYFEDCAHHGADPFCRAAKVAQWQTYLGLHYRR